MKKDSFFTPMVLIKVLKGYDLCTSFHCDSPKLYISFLPIYEWTNTLKLVGKKANNMSNQAGKELFSLRD